jgi:Tfp pilus assembly PilM family ATPase
MRDAVRKSSRFAPVAPAIAIEIASRRITVLKAGAASDRPTIAAYASEPLAPGVVTPALSGTNIPRPDDAAAALGRALDRAALGSTRRAALVVPDSIARVSLLSFDQLPTRASDLDQLVRWQIKKGTPFPIDEAQLTYFSLPGVGTGATVLAVVARKDVVAEYEAVAAAVGIHAGIVDLASFNVMNAIAGAGQAPPGDWLLVHLDGDATTLAILRGGQLLFYRHRTAVDDEPLGALVHQTAMYHEDRLAGGAFTRVLVCGGASTADGARLEIGERLGVPVEGVDLPSLALAGTQDRVSAEVLDALVAALGVLLRERKVA